MPVLASRSLAAIAVLLAVAGPFALAGETFEPLCRLAIHEEQAELETAELEVDLARSGLAAFEKIFELIEGLRKIDAIAPMAHRKAKYDRDAARLGLERADLVLERQEALIEQFRIVCEDRADDEASEDAVRAVARAHKRYREAHCGVLTKDVEIAEVNLEFNQEFLASVLDLREKRVATLTDVILAELDVEQEEKRLATGKKRTAACRRELAGI